MPLKSGFISIRNSSFVIWNRFLQPLGLPFVAPFRRLKISGDRQFHDITRGPREERGARLRSAPLTDSPARRRSVAPGSSRFHPPCNRPIAPSERSLSPATDHTHKEDRWETTPGRWGLPVRNDASTAIARPGHRLESAPGLASWPSNDMPSQWFRIT
jgi:hypothetical protein